MNRYRNYMFKKWLNYLKGFKEFKKEGIIDKKERPMLFIKYINWYAYNVDIGKLG